MVLSITRRAGVYVWHASQKWKLRYRQTDKNLGLNCDGARHSIYIPTSKNDLILC